VQHDAGSGDLAAMSTTLAAFAPILMIGGTIGQMMACFAAGCGRGPDRQPARVLSGAARSLGQLACRAEGARLVLVAPVPSCAGAWSCFLTGLTDRLAVDLALGANDNGLRAAARGFAELPSIARMAIVVAVSLAFWPPCWNGCFWR
jgi:hypothetical protein